MTGLDNLMYVVTAPDGRPSRKTLRHYWTVQQVQNQLQSAMRYEIRAVQAGDTNILSLADAQWINEMPTTSPWPDPQPRQRRRPYVLASMRP